ncbi:SusC/RagA family TonB-linked outer membrane protein [Arcticibacter sp.]|uniref:SusC/RagA family TonB-linked outer membrane protein n=1 Tax=Arcticibacter sp. TaxID=1872630 RepID=UPI00388FAF2E
MRRNLPPLRHVLLLMIFFQFLVSAGFAQKTATGKVVDEHDLPLPGVSVRAVGTNTGGVTDTQGMFKVSVPAGVDSLSLSFLGYTTKRISVNSSGVTIKMTPDQANVLEDVVVVAYGQRQRKIETLGSQSGLKIQDLKQPVANITTVLAGRVSGLVGVQRSAEPGLDNADIYIRGMNTTSSNTPLVLVDGVERPFSNLDPNDVESFVILKDASSTSVYGVRGANGVILVTTKKGVEGRTKINFDAYQGFTEFTRVPKAADGITYMQMANEASTTRGGLPIYSADRIQKTFSQEDPTLYPNVNWMDQLFNNFGNNRKVNMNISGGSDKMTYYVSASTYNENGLFKTDELQNYDSKISFDRYNFTSALDIKATKTTTINLGIKGFITDGNYPGTGTQEIFGEAFETYPILYPVGKYPNGAEPFTSTGGGLNSPWALLTNRGYVTTFRNELNSDIRVNQDLSFWVKGLSARVLFSFDSRNDNRISRTKSPYTNYAIGRDADGNLLYENQSVSAGSDFLNFSRNSGGERQFYLESAVNYDNYFGKHHVTGLFLYNQTDKQLATAGDLILSLPFRNLGLVARGSYSYDDRYLAEVSVGYNGAENFAPDQRFGFFPSGAVGWVLSNEKFFGKAKDVFQLLKFRASYGVVGNSRINVFNRSSPDSRDRFLFMEQVGSGGGYAFGQQWGSNSFEGLEIKRYAADVTWETEKDLNIGVELTTFKNALSIQADFFNRRRENIFILRESAIPASAGVTGTLVGNLGENNSKGVDLTVEFNKNFGQVGVGIRGTYTYNENEVLENDMPTQAYPWLDRRGYPIGQRFGYVAQGFYTQEEIDNPDVAKTAGVVMAGDLKYQDLNEDGVIDGFDRKAIGRSDIPATTYGFGANISFKNFSLGAFFQGIGDVDLYLSNQFMPFRNSSARGGLYYNIEDRWTPENPRQDAFYPRLSYSEINQNYSAESSHWLMNGKFLRLKTLDFGYTVPKKTFARLGVQNMRVYFIGYNLFTISPFKMYDPEMGNGSGTRYPNIKTYSLGLNVSF